MDTVMALCEIQSRKKLFSRTSLFCLTFLTLYIILGIINICRHEMWRDELHIWAVCKSSDSVSQLLYNKRYDGIPPLWYFLCYILTRFTENPDSMKIAHLILSTATAYLILKFAPFKNINKVLLVFGYFFAYEYAVIARPYALGIFFFFAALTLYLKKPTKLHFTAPILSLSLMSDPLSFILAWALAFIILLNLISKKYFEKADTKIRPESIIFSVILFIAVSIISARLSLPPPDSSAGIVNYFDITRAAWVTTAVWKSYVPIQNSFFHFWNTNFINSKLLQFILSVLLVCTFVVIFLRKPVIAAGYCVVNLALLAFFYFVRHQYLRHYGFLFITLIMCLWLWPYCRQKKLPIPALNSLSCLLADKLSLILTIILSGHLIAASIAVAGDYKYPFSTSQKATDFIKKNNFDDMLIAGDDDCLVLAIAARLDKPVHFLYSGQFSRYYMFKKLNPPDKPLPISERRRLVINKALQIQLQQKRDLLLILTYKADPKQYPIIKLAEFKGCIASREKFFLYIMKYQPELDTQISNN